MARGVCPILWQNERQTVTLLDIPRSIAAAQGTKQSPFGGKILSNPAVETPYATNEPRAVNAKLNVLQNAVNDALAQVHRELLTSALQEVRTCHLGRWCLDRTLRDDTHEPISKKRKLAEQATDVSKSTLAQSKNDILSEEMNEESAVDDSKLPSGTSTLCQECGYSENFYCNLPATTIEVSLLTSSQATYLVPPRISFYYGDCADSKSFHTSIRNQAQTHDTRRHFDLILLDPPWPNTSVKRTHKTPGSTYATIRTLEGVSKLLFGTDLDMLMAENCLVGFWITNRAAARDLLLGPGGVFNTWSLELEEEWIWLKITTRGEPVTPIDALWRKPYEILLLGRKQRSTSFNRSNENIVPERRVILGVPDVHSRKPCLKELIEPLLSRKDGYRALEVFSRHLVAGWWSWGNECIKFNKEGNWKREEG